MKQVRMSDIAQKLGISVVSVSNGLAGRSGVSDEMRARILQTAAELGYGSYGKAQTKPLRHRNIGLVCPERSFSNTTNNFYITLYRAVSQECERLGCSVLLELISHTAEHICTLPRLVTDHRVDALIFLGDVEQKYLDSVLSTGLPGILLDFYRQTQPPTDVVLSDNVQGGDRLTQHLLEQGKRRICFVGSIFSTTSNMDRYLGYTAALLRWGLAPQPELRIEDRDEYGFFIPLQLPEPMPDAFVCACDEVAFHLIRALQVLGLQVPEDVCVAGYDDSRFSLLSVPPITAYRVDTDSMAAAAVRRLLDRLEGSSAWSGCSVITGQLIPRASTGSGNSDGNPSL